MLNIHFKEKTKGQMKPIGIYAKKARGAMANYMMQHKIDEPLELKAFTGLGYRFCDKSSDENNFNFVCCKKDQHCPTIYKRGFSL